MNAAVVLRCSSPAICRFAEADPQAFWVAADAHERANGRTYTEVQVALPRELSVEQRQELARELLGIVSRTR